MLVLSRKVGEEIVIDECIRVKVIEVRGGRVRLGFDAPDFVSVLRGEIAEKPSENVDETVVLPAASTTDSSTENEKPTVILS